MDANITEQKPLTAMPSAPCAMPLHRTHIKAGQPWWFVDWKEIWEYRELLWNLVCRDFVTVYKQTILGPLWFIFQPLAVTLTFTVVFGNLAKIPTDNLPPFLFYMSGIVCVLISCS